MYFVYRRILAKYCHQHSRYYSRTPVIGVLGHVDHGKTSLIDNLRMTNNVSLEAGGITQRNSVFQHTIPENQFKFTIVDTPGHAAFSSMRVNGTALTDVAILVVDAAEGVKQQTIECIKLLQDNNIPIVVALNKMDLPKANFNRSVEMLFEQGVETEQVGGNIPAIGISALHGNNVSQLMNAVKGVAESLDLTANLDCVMEGIIFDIQPNRNKQILTTIIVQSGTIRKGDTIITGDQATLVKSIISPDGDKLLVGKPGMPVVIFGHQRTSEYYCVGSTLYSITAARGFIQFQKNRELIKELQAKSIEERSSTKTLYEKLPSGKSKISCMICADSVSTIDTLTQMLDVDSDELKLSIFSTTVKSLTQEQIRIAEAINAQIILFNVAPLQYETTAVVHHFDIIYDLAASITNELQTLLPPLLKRTVIGHGVVESIHGTTKKRVVGINHLRGKFVDGDSYTIKRHGFPIWNGLIASMRFMKEPIYETSDKMKECGISFTKNSVPTLKLGDILECCRDNVVQREFLNMKFFGKQDLVSDNCY